MFAYLWASTGNRRGPDSMQDVYRILRIVAEVSGNTTHRLPLSVAEDLVRLEAAMGATAFRQRLEQARGKVYMGVHLADYIRLTIRDDWARALGKPLEPRPQWTRNKWRKPRSKR